MFSLLKEELAEADHVILVADTQPPGKGALFLEVDSPS